MSTRTIALLLAGTSLALSTAACTNGTTTPAAATPPTAVTATSPAAPAPSRSSAATGTTTASKAQLRFADEGAFPFQVALLNLKATDGDGKPADDDRERLSCGGSLLDERHVLTAGHCFYSDGENPLDPRKDLQVVVGRTTLTSKQGQVRRITRVELHPLYSQRPLSYDVAVLTLDRPVTGIAPVTLVQPGDTSLQSLGSLVTFTGWGSPETHRDNEPIQPSSNRMKQASVPIMAGEACRKAYQKHEYQAPPDLRVSLCTSTTDQIGHCVGDSGGPLFATDGGRVVQLGVVSFAVGCGDPLYPSVYTRLNKGDINAFIRKAAGSDG